MKTERIDGIKWPEEIPMPQLGGFYVGGYHDSHLTAEITRSCLLGWSLRSFSWAGCDHAKRIFNDVMLAIVEERGFHSVNTFNDDPSTTDADRMAVWDEAAAEFGYERTEENWTP